MRKNKLRELFFNNKPSLSVRLSSTWPAVVEMTGYTKLFDYVELVAEYVPWTIRELEDFSRAVDLFVNMSSMIKIDQNNRAFMAQRALGSGFQNVLFADLRNEEDVRECIKIVKPDIPGTGGLNGAANRRNVRYGLEGGSLEHVKSMNDTVIALMIEKKSIVEDLDNILSIPGIDMVQFGPGDYSMSIGYPGERNHPKVKEAELYTIKTALSKQIRPRIEIGKINYDINEVKKYIDLGILDFSLPGELTILYQWLKENGRKFIDILSVL